MIRKDQMRLVADHDPVADVDAGGHQLVDFAQQGLRIDDNAVADDARDARMQNAGRDQAQHELLSVHVHGVSRVVAALIARNDGEMRRDEVDDLSFAFVAPLRTEDREVHERLDSTSSRDHTFDRHEYVRENEQLASQEKFFSDGTHFQFDNVRDAS